MIFILFYHNILNNFQLLFDWVKGAFFALTALFK